MLKRITCLALSLVLLWGILAQQVVAAGNETDISSASETFSIESEAEVTLPEGPLLFVDGSIVEDSALTYHEGIAYVSLRHASLALRPDAEITWKRNYAAVSADGLYFTVDPDENYVTANDRCLYVPEGILLNNGVICVPVQVIAEVFDATLSYNKETQDVELTSGSGALVPADKFYNKDDLYWLSHIIYAESGNQPLSGKIAVGNVVMNRAADPIFPNSIYGVVFQKNQFTPVKNGTINLTPNKESVLAAKLCLDGAVILPTALWFNRANSNSWAARHKEYITTIGSHAFYA